jgi:hypothetical protein
MRSNPVLCVIAIGAFVAALSGCHRGSEPPPAAQTETSSTAVVENTPPAQAPAENPPAETAPAAVQPKAPAPAPVSAPAPVATPTDNPPAPKADADAKPPAEQSVDPLKWLADREARRVDYEQKVKRAEADLAVATASVTDWEKTVLAFENPFRPRPQLGAEDATAIESMDGAQRVKWAKGRLEAARSSRDAAQKTIDDLKANPPPE